MTTKKVFVGTLLVCIVTVTLVIVVMTVRVGQGMMHLIGQMTSAMPDSPPLPKKPKPKPAGAKALHKGEPVKGIVRGFP